MTTIAVVAHGPSARPPRPGRASGTSGAIGAIGAIGTVTEVPRDHRGGRAAGTGTLPAAVAEPVLGLVSGPLLPATVLAAHSAAAVLTCDVPSPDGGETVTRVVTVLAVEASGVPNGVRTALHAADRPFGHLSPGDPAFVGALGIRLPRLELRAVRVVRTAVPPVHPSPAAVTAIAHAARSAPRGVPDHVVLAFAEALASQSAAGLRAAVTSLVGLGSGSTPGGDDVLCGALAGLHATGRVGLAERIGIAALDGVAARTPLLSADLLRLAARGHACAEAGAVLRACGAGAGALDRALDRLLAIGHTSGADLATGLALGLGVPIRSPERPSAH